MPTSGFIRQQEPWRALLWKGGTLFLHGELTTPAGKIQSCIRLSKSARYLNSISGHDEEAL